MEKTALVTGASQGLGKEIAIKLAKENIFVFVNYSKSHSKAESVVSEIKSSGGSAEAICADVSDETQVKKMIDIISSKKEKIDFLINNAGIDNPQAFETYNLKDWRRIIEVNLTGKFIVLQAALPLLKKSAAASVINLSSSLGLKPEAEASSYCCSESAIIMLTKCAALELASYKIRVNTICPGFTRTPMNEKLFPDKKIWEEIAENNPLKRIGEPKDVANMVSFLVSENASYINGTHLFVDGGGSIK